MNFRILLVVLTFACLIAACEFRVEENKASQGAAVYRRCADVEKLKLGEAGPKLESLFREKNYNCVEQLLRAETLVQPDSHVITILLNILEANVSVTPDTLPLPISTKLAALSYLNVHVQPAKTQGFRLEKYGDFIRAEVKNGTGEIRSDAFSLLFNIMQDSDIPLIVDSIKTGDESMVALGMYALAGSCSSASVVALKEVLKHHAVISYIQKYKDKEDISRAIRQKCSAALRDNNKDSAPTN